MAKGYEDGFKAGMKHGQDEIHRTTLERLDKDERLEFEREEPETQEQYDQRYPLTLAAIYHSWESPSDKYEVVPTSTFQHLVIKPEPIDPTRRTYKDGFIDGLCCILVANSDVLSENPDVTFADAWMDPGWHKAFSRAFIRAGYKERTRYSPDGFRLVKV